MNKLIPVALMVGVLVATSAFGYGYSSGTQVRDGIRVTGWVKVQVVRDGKIIYFHEGHNLITNMGKDIISKEVLGANGNGTVRHNPNATLFIALTTDTGAPAAGDTTLASEITTGGLARATAAYNHANSTTTVVLRKTFTASASFTAVQKAGLFNVPPSGSAATTGMLAENTFSSVNLISGDQITITWTITIA